MTLAHVLIIAAGGLPRALHYLSISESDYQTIDNPSAMADVQYVTSVVFHNLGMTKERDEAAARVLASEEECKRLADLDVDATFKDIWNLVTEVSAALSSR